jgi:hypothetical protein
MFCPFCGENIQVTFKHCPFCGRQLPDFTNNEVHIAKGETCDDLITQYFRQGFAYQKILILLAKYHSIEISLRTLNNKLKLLDLRRRNNDYELNLVPKHIQHEIDGPGSSAA